MNRKMAAQDAAQIVPFVIEQNNGTGSVSLWRHGDNQSACDARGVSTAAYIHALYGFLRQARARNVLMIVGGGGTLATMLDRAGAKPVIVDIDTASFALARHYFHLPDHIACHAADGLAYLRRHAQRYDSIVLDAFSKTQVPHHLLTPAFFAAAKARLRPRGIFLVNLIVIDDDDPRPDSIAERMSWLWRDVRILGRDGWENCMRFCWLARSAH